MSGRRHLRRWAPGAWLALAPALAPGCFDRGDRWNLTEAPVVPFCDVGTRQCRLGKLDECQAKPGGEAWVTVDDCAAEGRVCVPSLLACKACLPSDDYCDGLDVRTCDASGDSSTLVEECGAIGKGWACRAGACVNLCAVATLEKSNVGCEYWAADLDNARISFTSNAAAQQFAVVVSNPQAELAADVEIYQDDGPVGGPHQPVLVAKATIAPRNLRVFNLGPREVDGSPPGQFDTGTHTALTRHAFRVDASVPVVAYQFNPLENANVFSNDASLLKPREAFTYDGNTLTTAYVVGGWPQTIAITDDPNTNFDPSNPIALRAFLTIVAATDGTVVEVEPTTAVLGGGLVPPTASGEVLTVTLDAFDVLNLETDDFDADFTGSVVRATGPVAVFSGSEASDAPRFDTLAERRCCADHLEEQLDPIRAAGSVFAVPHTPSRTRTVKAAGGDIEEVPEPDYVRFVSATPEGAVVTTTLPPPYDELVLVGLGDYAEVVAERDFVASSTRPLHVVQIAASQDAANVRRGLPGGDPSLVVVPPVEQFRADYVFLTPDKYAFDFVTVVSPPGAIVYLDDLPIEQASCDVADGDGLTAEERGSPTPPYYVYRCQLGFAAVDPLLQAPDNVFPGIQKDGVHRVLADQAVGVFVSGFDSYVSYGYAAGTELREIAPPF